MKFKIFSRYLFLFLAIVTMVYIFIMSSQTSTVSSKSSGRVIETIARIFIKDFQNASPEQKITFIKMYQGIVRTVAHFAVFSCLGFSVCGHLFTYSIESRKLKNLFSFLFCFLYAVSDEIHQLFVSGRSCQIKDIVIDSFGVISGILIINLLYFIFKKIRLNFARKAAI